ncbi:MAG: DUF4097 family beta strand repeat-containing protein [Cellulophaga sp.]
MKKITTIITVLLIVGNSYSQDNEKHIKFNKGTLKICSISNFQIRGYDGDEVIIKSLNNGTRFRYHHFSQKNENMVEKSQSSPYRRITSVDKKNELKKGLKPLGNKTTNSTASLYIIENPGELIIRDNNIGGIINLSHNKNKYELLIPNSIKLLWNTENCTKTNLNTSFMAINSRPWELSNFKGEVEISASYGSIYLVDVSGPVIANTLGGNIKVVFDNITPNNLYSLISNDGYIDVTLPQNANIKVDAIGDDILSDIDFQVLNETIINGTKEMELQLNSGKTKMKLDSRSGTVYLRKKK